MVRIWLPFLTAALMLLYFLAVYIPDLQRETLLRFHRDKLETVAGTIERVLEYGLPNEDWALVHDIMLGVPNVEYVDRIGVLTEDLDTLDILEFKGVHVEGEQLLSLLPDEVTVEQMAALTEWEGELPPSVDGFFTNGKLPGVSAEQFCSLLDSELVVRVGLDYDREQVEFGTTALVVGSQAMFAQELQALREPFILIQTLLALGAIALFYYLAFHISRPIISIASVAEEMRKGNLQVDIDASSSLNELSMLTEALTELRDDLVVKRRENEELTNDMEAKIVERTEQLEEAMRAKDDFLSTMSHEIRTPLHSLIAIGEMLRKEQSTEHRQELLMSLNTSSKQLLALINDILDFSKISAGKLELHLEPIHLRPFFEELAAPFVQTKKTSIEFVKSFPETLEDHVVKGDAMRLSQILHNLLSNAFKFTEEGEVILGVRCKMVQRGGENFIGLEVQVVDTGVGIAEENVDAIVAAFTQENSSISRKFGGTGLGLSIVNRLLHMMGSELEIQSTLGHGSMFGFYLELPSVHEEVVSPSAAAVEAEVDLSKLRLLYVEDMDPNRFVMQAMVRPWDVQLVMAESGQRALEILSEQSFDLVLMDIQMPEMDGVETLKQIRAHSGEKWKTPVIAFTAHAQEKDVKHYLSEGFTEVLTKPAGPDLLRSVLNRFVVNN